jgi:hypothetical protein
MFNIWIAILIKGWNLVKFRQVITLSLTSRPRKPVNAAGQQGSIAAQSIGGTNGDGRTAASALSGPGGRRLDKKNASPGVG